LFFIPGCQVKKGKNKIVYSSISEIQSLEASDFVLLLAKKKI
jgi:hypothetical protein